jgi:hypothetical protein
MTSTLVRDGINWKAYARVEKYSAAQTAFAVRRSGLVEPDGSLLRKLCGAPEDGTAEAFGNLLVTVGLAAITGLIIGGGGNAFSHTNAIVGVGAGTTTAAITDTALTDDNTSNAYYQQADASFPTNSNGVITCQCTFASGNANYAWQEWCWAIGGGGTITAGDHLSAVTATAPTMVNHKVQSLGTKGSGSSWVFTTTVTLS